MSLTAEERLARVEAREAIRDQVARYALGADRRNDPEIMGPLFAPDASWEAAGFGLLRGRAAIAEGLADIGRRQMLWTTHFMVSPLVELDEDAAGARCRWYLWELAKMDDGDGQPRDRWIAGFYDSRLAPFGDAWLFTSVVLDLRLMADTGAPWKES